MLARLASAMLGIVLLLGGGTAQAQVSPLGKAFATGEGVHRDAAQAAPLLFAITAARPTPRAAAAIALANLPASR